MKISTVKALEILDSRGKPTLRTFVTLSDGSIHSAAVPSGASTGIHEAVELRDNDPKRYLGQGVKQAVDNVNQLIAPKLIDHSVDPNQVDQLMIALDATPNKAHLGANAILSVSQAVVRAGAYVNKKPLWQYIHEYYSPTTPVQFPRLMVNIINGGKHAGWNFDIQEFMIIPNQVHPANSVRMAAEIFLALGKLLKQRGFSTLVGDEGGYSPALTSNEQAYDTIIEAAHTVGYVNGQDYYLAMDAAASEFYENSNYVLKKDHKIIDGKQLIDYYSSLQAQYKILSLEDVFEQDDWDNFVAFTQLAKERGFTVVGDDLTVTNPQRIGKAGQMQAANGVIIKMNQIGTMHETIEAIKTARSYGWKIVISHRSGETEDSFIADLAYGTGADFIKTGSMSRSERLSKYNRLLEIEHGF